jgi:hypothetical protein
MPRSTSRRSRAPATTVPLPDEAAIETAKAMSSPITDRQARRPPSSATIQDRVGWGGVGGPMPSASRSKARKIVFTRVGTTRRSACPRCGARGRADNGLLTAAIVISAILPPRRQAADVTAGRTRWSPI